MADNSNSGQYQVSDPAGNTPESAQAQQVAPTPDGQMPPQQPAPQTAPAGSPAPNPNAPDASSPNPGPQGGQVANPQDQNQAPSQQGPTPAQTRTQKFLSRAREITDAIAGGDPYKTTIDPTTGVTTRTPQPLNPRAISLSIILEALQGGLSGAGEHGPNAIGQAAQAGLQQGEKIADQRQQAQAQQDQQAQTDLKTRQQVIMNLLQTRQLAMSLGRQSLDEAQESVKADAPSWEQHQEDPTSILGQDMSHDDAYAMLNKLGLGNSQVLITGAHPRTDPKTGAPVYQLPTGQVVPEGTPGAYQAPNFTYAVVKPDSKIDFTDNEGNVLPQYAKAISRGYAAGNTSANGKYPPNFQITSIASQSALRGSQTADAVQADVDKSRQALGLSPISIDSDLKNDPNTRQGLIQYNAVLNAGGTHAQALQAVLNSKYASAAGTINNWYGGRQATALLDQQTANTDFDNGIIYGHAPIVTRADADRAAASANPKVAAAGKAAQTRMDQEAAQTEFRKAQAEEQGKLPGELQLANVRANAGSGGTDSIKQTADAVANGTLTLDTITDRPTRSKVERQLAVDHPNLDQNSVTMTPDERKKKQLADSVVLNLNGVKDIIQRRPDLVGIINGRLSQGKGLLGSNDKDLSKIAVYLDQYGQAAVGIHGSRSYQNKEEAAHVLLNNFKNGPQAALGAIDAANQSADVFRHAGTPRSKNGSPYIVIPTPQTQGQVIDGPTVQKYITKYGSPAAARTAAIADGWALPNQTGGK